MAAALVIAQLRAHMALSYYASAPTLGLLYITDHYAASAGDILKYFEGELPEVTDWAGTVGIGVAANNAEYFDEPALTVMLCDLPADQYRVFSGVAPLGIGFDPYTALIHADASTPDVADLIEEMASRTDSGYLFGGLASSRTQRVQFAVGGNGNISGYGAANGVFTGGLSGVAFGEGVNLVSRVTQGCQPITPIRSVTSALNNVILEIDGEPALDVLLADLQISLEEPESALKRVRATLIGLMNAQAEDDDELDDGALGEFGALGVPQSRDVSRPGSFGSDVIVRHIIGLDPGRKGIAISDMVHEGMRMAFCQRNVSAARADLVRICAEIREELEPEEVTLETAAELSSSPALSSPHPARRIAGALYVSCSGRGGPHFGAPSAELQIVRRALGDVPLVGFFAGGEIARNHLYGYTGVLTVFTTEVGHSH